MNKPKLKGFHKFLSLLLAATILILGVGFAVSGWDGAQDGNNSGDVGDGSDNVDENKNPQDDNTVNDPPVSDTPKPDNTEPTTTYKNTITGLPVSKEEFESVPLGIVIDSQSNFYGISTSDMILEFPIENGASRLLCYTTNEQIMWKIGALKATRNYISNVSSFFGGVVVSYGKDDIVYYDAWETEKIELDLSQYSDCYYLENTLYIYTTENMIETAKNRLPLTTELSEYQSPPYNLSFDKTVYGVTAAQSITIPYSNDNLTSLVYNTNDAYYEYKKSDMSKTDMLTGEKIKFSNIFILFANATTYENASGTELVIDTLSGGKGYYISHGTLTEFTWSTDSQGNLYFKNLMGNMLEINPGNVYIAYYKASIASKIQIS